MDETKYGQAEKQNYPYARRLMQNMGWGGGGLGANETGISEPIRVLTRSKPTGLGYYEKHDQHLDRQDDFNDVLLSLNENHNSEAACQDVEFSSLEKKSKSSRHRVHYQKFTRGKDVSRYSEQDLQAILGKRERKSKPKTEDEIVDDQLSAPHLLLSFTGDINGDTTKNGSINSDGEIGSVDASIENGDETTAMPKTKKRRKNADVSLTDHGIDSADTPIEADDETTVTPKTKKRRKHTDVAFADDFLEEIDARSSNIATPFADDKTDGDESIAAEERRGRKKSKKNRHQEVLETESTYADAPLDEDVAATKCEEKRRVKKSKKTRDGVDLAEETATEVSIEEATLDNGHTATECTEVRDSSKKSKKNRDRLNTNTDAGNINHDIVLVNGDVTSKAVEEGRRKKKSKKTNSDHVISSLDDTTKSEEGQLLQETVDSEMLNEFSDGAVKKKKRKQKVVEHCDSNDAATELNVSNCTTPDADNTDVLESEARRQKKHKRRMDKFDESVAAAAEDSTEQQLALDESGSKSSPDAENDQVNETKQRNSCPKENGKLRAKSPGKKAKSKLASLLKKMARIDMFKGSNLSSISGYP